MAAQAPKARGYETVKWLAANWWAIPTVAAIIWLAFVVGRRK